MHRAHRSSTVVSSLALAWTLLAATPAAALSPVPPLDPDQPQPSETSSVETPAEEEAEVKPGRGAPVLKVGDRGRKVNVLQVRLQRVGVRDMPINGLFDEQTTAQVKRFQRLAGFARSGVLDQGTLDDLNRRTGEVDRLDLAAGENRPYGRRLPASCLVERVICVDKRALAVRWVVDGEIKQRLDARFGSDEFPTREGVFAVTRKSRAHVSSIYHTSMPFALFFDRGQAVHYSPDFAARGYYGASHGCVNTRDYDGMRALFGRADVGDRVVVYRSRSAKRLKPATETETAAPKA
jgi:peptidoglycan hydrolase-like protein with peptidoglycan-binding domain